MRYSAVATLLFVSFGACSKDQKDPTVLSSDGATDSGVSDTIVFDGTVFEDNQKEYDEIPKEPVVDNSAGNLPSDIATIFSNGSLSSEVGACLIEPESGTRFPNNWMRPQFVMNGDEGSNVLEFTLKAENQKNPYVTYFAKKPGKNPNFRIAKSIWDILRTHSYERKLTFQVRGGFLENGKVTNIKKGSEGDFEILKVDAPGAIVYWAANASSLKGFLLGDEGVVDVLASAQLPPVSSQNAKVNCIGCHVGTPEGTHTFLATRATPQNGGGDLWSRELSANIDVNEPALRGKALSLIKPNVKTFLEERQGALPAISTAYWNANDHRLLLPAKHESTGQFTLYDVRLEADTVKEFKRTGDPNGTPAGTPSFSHDGKEVVYTSGFTADGAAGDLNKDSSYPPSKGPYDLYRVDYNDGQGAAAKAVAGASEQAFNEVNASFSPDDTLIAFNRTPANVNPRSYPLSEVFIVDRKGGDATRLVANDIPACRKDVKVGELSNSWPKWAPKVAERNGKSYYFLVFSSKKNGGPSQLFAAPIVKDAAGKVTTYPAIYFWNQPSDESNHTPAWEYFKLPSSEK